MPNRYVTPFNPIIKNAVYGLTTNPAAQSKAPVLSAVEDNTTAAARARQQAFKARSNEIGASGANASAYLQQAIAKRNSMAAEKARRAQMQFSFPDADSAYKQFLGPTGQSNFSPADLRSPAAVDRYLAALRQVESSGNYRARSKISSASGAYQYINSTWGNYGGYRTAAQAPKAVQDQRARQDAMRSFQKYGNWEQVAASHFYPAWAGDKSKWGNSPGRGNPTVAQYVRKVVSGMGVAASQGNFSRLPIGGDVSGIRNQIVNFGLRQQGIPYVWGGKTTRGFDCSGLTSYVYRQFGINLPAWSNHQTAFGKRTNIAYAKPGDLVGWNKGGHVAIYIGGGKILHSPRPGSRVHVRSLFPNEAVYAVRLTLPGD